VKLRLTARVESAGVTEEPFGVEVPPYVVELGCDEGNRIVEIRIEKHVDVSDVALPSTSISEDQRVTIRTTTNDPQFQDVLDLVQFIESIGSFHLGIRRIDWARAKYEWIPESDDERRKLTLFAVEMKLQYPQTPVPVDPDTLFRLVRSRERLDRYKIPMAFFREGVNDFRGFRYVNAFHNLYFFLEDLFGGGKTRNKQVEANFIASTDVRQAVSQTVADLRSPDRLRHRTGIETFLKAENCDWTPQGVIRFLVQMRGNLHHFSQRSTKPKGHPLNQHEFEAVAFLLQMICYRIVVSLVK
jgi:hypothetical protein